MKVLIFCLVLVAVLKFNTAEELPAGCPADEDPRYPTHLPHTNDCTKFWKCDNGIPYLHYCEGGLQWSIENSWCDYPENAKCVRPIPEDGSENGGGEDGGEDSDEEGGETDLPTGCPADEDARYPTHLPHATDCDKFWKCWDGVPYLNECPQGQHWSIENTWCDYIENAKCVRPIPEDSGEPEELGGEDGGEESERTDLPTGCPPDEDPRYPTHLPHATDCDKFWKCLNGVPYIHDCPQGQHWNIENTWCDYIENAQCVRPIPEDGGENGGGEESGENGGGEESGENGGGENSGENGEENIPPTDCPVESDPSGASHIPHATDCTKFWQCVGGNAYLSQCPSGLHWNIEAQYCDYIENANCIRPFREKIDESVNLALSVAEGYSCPAEEDVESPVHLPHASDCTKFYKCFAGKPILQECPGALEWNIEGNYCDYPENANCVPSLQGPIEPENLALPEDGSEIDLPTGCPPDEDPRYPTHLPHATDCDKFWKCWDGVPYLNECPQGQHWSIENTWCDYVENAKCVRPIPEDGSENGGGEDGGEDSDEEGGETDLPTGCPADEDARYPTHLPHATDCDKFWKCWDGVPYLNECPQGQHWSIENTWCDYIENAKCVRPIPEDSGEPEELGGEDGGEESERTDLPTGCPPDEDPRYPTHLPHATDCDKFWKCLNGVPYIHDCPQGQHWNIENTWCDYIENAQCVRPIPEDGGENGGGEESGENGGGEESGENGGGEKSGENGEENIPPTDCPVESDPSGASHIPHATDCTKFWQCVGGNAYLTQCPSGLHWNIEAQYCDYIENANCIRPLREKIDESVNLALSVAEGYSCPAEEDVESPVHLPHASDCTKFYKCFAGKPILQECPGALEWNIEGNYCDYPENANCVPSLQGPIEPENLALPEDGSEIDLPTGCPPDEDPRYPTHLPHATDCDKFWKCWDGVPYLNECPQGQHWSIENTWCDYVENAKCVRPIPEDGSENGGGEDGGEDSDEEGGETDLPTGCPADEDARYPTHLPHATDCDKFWKCWDGVPYLNECPQGQHWSIENTWCDYIENAKCVRPIPEDSGEPEELGGEDGGEESERTDLPTGCPPDEDPRYPTHLPHATDCDKFWKCLNGVPYIHDCPQGQHWNIENTWCDYIENAQCVRPIPEDGGENGGGEESGENGGGEESGENGGGENSGENGEENIPPTDCPVESDPSGASHIPHATDCTKFWQCVGGNAYLTQCPSGLHWNIEAQYCDYIENANCIRPLREKIDESVNLALSVAEGYSCPAEEDVESPVHLPHASDCTKFYKCFAGKPILQECPGALEWNIEGNYCDYPSEANCVRSLVY